MVAVLAALENGHAEDGVEVGEGGECGTGWVEEFEAGVAILLDALAETPAVDVDSDDGGRGEVLGERKRLFAGRTAEGEDGGGGSILQMVQAGGEEFGVAIGFGVGGALIVGGSVESTGYLLGTDAGIEGETADVAEGAEGAGERSQESAG